MAHTIPDSLSNLLAATDDAGREHAWDAFILEFNGLIMHVVRRTGGDHDAVMDRYAFIIRAIREDDFRRLRTYKPTDGARFTTWFLVVARRLCLDQFRARYGRSQSESTTAIENHQERRRLADLVSSEISVDTVEGPDGHDPDSIIRDKELTERLNSALDSLPESDRLLLRFRFEDDLSVPKIARLLGEESPFAIYRRLDRILVTMRASLEGSGVTEPMP